MKKAHKYRLQITFSSGINWDLFIVAIDAENVSTWLRCGNKETDERYILNVTIELIERNFEDVKERFCAKSLS
jgi:hypothetical protein